MRHRKHEPRAREGRGNPLLCPFHHATRTHTTAHAHANAASANSPSSRQPLPAQQHLQPMVFVWAVICATTLIGQRKKRGEQEQTVLRSVRNRKQERTALKEKPERKAKPFPVWISFNDCSFPLSFVCCRRIYPQNVRCHSKARAKKGRKQVPSFRTRPCRPSIRPSIVPICCKRDAQSHCAVNVLLANDCRAFPREHKASHQTLQKKNDVAAVVQVKNTRAKSLHDLGQSRFVMPNGCAALE